MKYPILLSALALAFHTRAQNIDAYRYWFDDSASDAVTTAVTPTAELALNAALPTGSMESGYHRMSVQFRDTDGNWSSPHTTVFSRSGTTVSGYRYWLNDDPATLTTGAIPSGSTVDLDAMLATNTGARDFNLVTIQFSDPDGLYSAPVTKAFTRSTGAVNGYEYWIDDAVEDRVANSIGPSGVVDLLADLPLATMVGDHVFTIRFRGENGTWSVPLTTQFSFQVGLPELPGLSDLLLFPNPTNGQLALRLTSADNGQLRLSVLDATGRVVRAEETWTPTGTAVRTWDLADLAAGSYGLRIVRGEQQTTMRFQKN